ncbi:TetR/AcrR family transcriptional regulator [Rugosimonospora acidiphila]|uniref:TetR/AcrR family transcriptional regulator n=1 Tax=Rugosimonospora acidiphila TaxID=556531 RepID=A0ABP9SUH5_9ACTN
MTLAQLEGLRAPRPHRADAARNYTDVALDEVARRAGVGIATLYRNFPTRDSLIENVYLYEVEAVCAYAVNAAMLRPWQSVTSWLQRFVDYVTTRRAVSAAINRDSEIHLACARALAEAGGALLTRAQQAGVVRADVDIDDVLRCLIGAAAVNFASAQQRQRMFEVLLDGLRARNPVT